MKIRQTNTRYATLVWLTSVICSPVLMELYFYLFDQELTFGLNVIFLATIFGGILSLPNWILFMLAVQFVNRSDMPSNSKKILLQGIATILTFLLFYVIFSLLNEQPMLFPELMGVAIFYIITLSVAIWIFKLETIAGEPYMEEYPDILDQEM